MKQKIGFIGLGIMGRHMAKHLLSAGYEVVAYDIVPAAIEQVVSAGAERGPQERDRAQPRRHPRGSVQEAGALPDAVGRRGSRGSLSRSGSAVEIRIRCRDPGGKRPLLPARINPPAYGCFRRRRQRRRFGGR